MIVVAGSLNMDLVGQVPHLAAWGETVMGEGFARFAGGKGGNQAVAAARLGASVAIAGAVGDDPFGAELRAGLQAEGIEVAQVQLAKAAATGCALIQVGPDGDNAISVLPGANRLAPPPPLTWPTDWQMLLLQLEIPMPTNLAWALAARQAGVPVLLNAAPMSTLAADLLRQVDVLVVNEGELRALAGLQPDVSQALAVAAASGPARVVVTLGAQGCAAWDAGARLQVPGQPVPVVDSTGAGDTFVGALAAGLWQRRPWAECLVRANAAAAVSCTRPGARGGMPREDELNTRLAG